jgi:hypothetical protein
VLRVERPRDGPIIGPETHPSIGVNIQGPSLIRAPDWLPGRMGQYYLYFADHKGDYIRLATADALAGPWRVHPPGSLHLRDSCFLTAPPVASAAQLALFEERARRAGTLLSHDIRSEITTPHIASPDVHVDHVGRRIVMYYHGLEDVGTQVTRVALSADGVSFRALPDVVADRSYLRVFAYRGQTYGLAMPGQVYHAPDPLGVFVPGPMLFNPAMRHAALRLRGDTLDVFWTQVGEAPERILLSHIDLRGDWRAWRETAAVEVMRPERDWEGADAPLTPSIRSTAYGHVNQLRDPAIYEEDGRTFLLYAVAGESGIGIAALREEL